MRSGLSRRRFLEVSASLGAAATVVPARSLRAFAANEKIAVALVGVSGRGQWFVETIPRIGEKVVALCDVNDARAAAAFAKFPDVPKFRDFRRMLDEQGDRIDAVVVATPDNTHAVIAAAAIRRGKHVYCEKPLAHDVAEARRLAELAAEHGVATQMGNQGTATDAFRRGVELIQDGALGEITEVHVWKDGGGSFRPRPQGESPVPPTLDWDLWLGPAAWRPYHPDWMHWHAWRDFATGMLGNWGTHSANLPFMALRLDAPWTGQPKSESRVVTLRAEVSQRLADNFPRWEAIRWDFPARGQLPPITLQWHNGYQPGRKRVEELLGWQLDWGDAGERRWKEHGGCLVAGTQGMLRATEHNSTIFLQPEDKFPGDAGPPRRLPRSGSHEREWLAACRGGPKPMSQFGYAGPLVEMLMLGNVATLFPGEELRFDAAACKIVNHAEADAALRRAYREGWSL